MENFPLDEPVAHENGKRRRSKTWRPKKWRPEYERIVAMSCLGWSNIMIAKETGYSKEHISNVLNLDESEAVRLEVLQRMRATTLRTVPENLEYIASKTAERLRTVVDDDELFERSPFQVIDRGLDVLKGLGHLKGGGNGSGGGLTVNVGQGGQAMVVSTNTADSLAEALARANEVKALHGGNVAAEIRVSAAEKVAK